MNEGLGELRCRRHFLAPVFCSFQICCGVRNEKKMKKFPQISVNSALRGVVGIRGRNTAA